MHEHEFDLRDPLAALYRGVKALGVAAGSELERLLRGDGVHPRAAHVAGRLIRVLAELRLISVEPGIPALALASESPTSLELSPAFRIYTQRHQDGRRFLSSENPPLLA
jgi:hypothetical protein